ncbi:MAG: hypothetical protein HC896_04530 [Bacteroidales bacterium]|nr:hypothetical protein [Bacteroidales bacterium]
MEQKHWANNRLLLWVILALGTNLAAHAAEDSAFVSEFYQENAQCMVCHGKQYYTWHSEELGITVKDYMCPSKQIDSADFYSSFHKSFSCFDCHSQDFTSYPHPLELRVEEAWNCLDCHGGDPEFAKYHFEEIETGYNESVHALENVEGFSCWSCHNPHSYQTVARTAADMQHKVAYANSICLSCHADEEKIALLYGKEDYQFMKSHDWLPRQAQHFKSVRCIDCHAQGHDSLTVAHKIMPADSAVKNCIECHSQNSILLASLYKHDVSQSRSRLGFTNGEIVKDFYVIGATRIKWLNILSVAIFCLVLIAVGTHKIRLIKTTKK